MPVEEKILCLSVLLKKYDMKILKMFKEEREIGEIFAYNGLSFICLESPSFFCGKCYFKQFNKTISPYNCNGSKLRKVRGRCSFHARSDNKSVYFKILTDEDIEKGKD